MVNSINPIRPGGEGRWGGKAESAAPVSTFENFLDQIFKEYLPNAATFI